MIDLKPVSINDNPESLKRPAWTQTLEQGMGSGLLAFKHKQVHKADGLLQRDYYVRSGGCR